VTVLVQMGGSLEKKDADGGTPLHCAAQQGHVNVVRALVHGGANKEAKGFDGETPLHWAVDNRQVEAVKVLAQLGADIAARSNAGITPLQICIRHGHLMVAQLLRELERTARTQQAATAFPAGACAACGSIPTTGDPLKTCGRCKAVQYCSALCQRTHWPVHKASCAAGTGDPAQQGGPSSARAPASIEPSALTPATGPAEAEVEEEFFDATATETETADGEPKELTANKQFCHNACGAWCPTRRGAVW
jgi:hypothetical protein